MYLSCIRKLGREPREEMCRIKRVSLLIPGHNQSVTVSCVPQFQPSHNSSLVCNNGTWSTVPKCIPAKCTELPDAPRNGMVVAPNMDHGMVGKFEVGSNSKDVTRQEAE